MLRHIISAKKTNCSPYEMPPINAGLFSGRVNALKLHHSQSVIVLRQYCLKECDIGPNAYSFPKKAYFRLRGCNDLSDK